MLNKKKKQKENVMNVNKFALKIFILLRKLSAQAVIFLCLSIFTLNSFPLVVYIAKILNTYLKIKYNNKYLYVNLMVYGRL